MSSNVLVLGGCGFIGSNITSFLNSQGCKVLVVDNLSRKDVDKNCFMIGREGITILRKSVETVTLLDLESFFSDLENLIIIDCAANPAVTAGITSGYNVSDLYRDNFMGLMRLLEIIPDSLKCSLIFISSSRIYSLLEMRNINLEVQGKRLQPANNKIRFLSEDDSVAAPITFYGASKLTAEMLIKEFAFIKKQNFSYTILRPGVISGPRQQGTSEQGFVALWVNSTLNSIPLRYIGYGNQGYQVRDILHIYDFVALINLIISNNWFHNQTYTCGGGIENSISLSELTDLCFEVTKKRPVISECAIEEGPYDVPYVVMSNKKIATELGWSPSRNVTDVIRDIALQPYLEIKNER